MPASGSAVLAITLFINSKIGIEELTVVVGQGFATSVAFEACQVGLNRESRASL
jgi:hypothetical protein